MVMLDKADILRRISLLMKEKSVSSYKLNQNTDVTTTINQ